MRNCGLKGESGVTRDSVSPIDLSIHLYPYLAMECILDVHWIYTVIQEQHLLTFSPFYHNCNPVVIDYLQWSGTLFAVFGIILEAIPIPTSNPQADYPIGKSDSVHIHSHVPFSTLRHQFSLRHSS